MDTDILLKANSIRSQISKLKDDLNKIENMKMFRYCKINLSDGYGSVDISHEGGRVLASLIQETTIPHFKKQIEDLEKQFNEL